MFPPVRGTAAGRLLDQDVSSPTKLGKQPPMLDLNVDYNTSTSKIGSELSDAQHTVPTDVSSAGQQVPFQRESSSPEDLTRSGMSSPGVSSLKSPKIRTSHNTPHAYPKVMSRQKARPETVMAYLNTHEEEGETPQSARLARREAELAPLLAREATTAPMHALRASLLESRQGSLSNNLKRKKKRAPLVQRTLSESTLASQQVMAPPRPPNYQSPPESIAPGPTATAVLVNPAAASALVPDTWTELASCVQPGAIFGPLMVEELKARLSPEYLRREWQMGDDGISRLYRALRVHSLGFHQTVRDCLGNQVHHRDLLLTDVWQFFTLLWDGQLKVSFDSEVNRMLSESKLTAARCRDAEAQRDTAVRDLGDMSKAFDDMVSQALQFAVERKEHAEQLVQAQNKGAAQARDNAAEQMNQLQAQYVSAMQEAQQKLSLQTSLTQQAQEELIDLRQQMSNTRKENAELVNSLRKTQEMEAERSEQLEMTSAELERTVNKLKESQGGHCTTQEELQEKHQELSRTQDEWRGMYRTIQLLRSDVMKKNEDLHDHQEQMQALRRELNEFKEGYATEKTRADKLQATVDAHAVEMNKLRDTIAKLESLANDQAKQIMQLEIILKTEREEHEDAMLLREAEHDQQVHFIEDRDREEITNLKNDIQILTEKTQKAQEIMKDYYDKFVRKREKKKKWKHECELAELEVKKLNRAMGEQQQKGRAEQLRLTKKITKSEASLVQARGRMENAAANSWMRTQEAAKTLEAVTKNLETSKAYAKSLEGKYATKAEQQAERNQQLKDHINNQDEAQKLERQKWDKEQNRLSEELSAAWSREMSMKKALETAEEKLLLAEDEHKTSVKEIKDSLTLENISVKNELSSALRRLASEQETASKEMKKQEELLAVVRAEAKKQEDDFMAEVAALRGKVRESKIMSENDLPPTGESRGATPPADVNVDADVDVGVEAGVESGGQGKGGGGPTNQQMMKQWNKDKAAMKVLQKELAAAQTRVMERDTETVRLVNKAEDLEDQFSTLGINHQALVVQNKNHEAQIMLLHKECAEAKELANLRKNYIDSLIKLMMDKSVTRKEFLKSCPVLDQVQEELLRSGAPDRELSMGQVGELTRRAGLTEQSSDNCCDQLDAKWHTSVRLMAEEQLSLKKMATEFIVFKGQIEKLLASITAITTEKENLKVENREALGNALRAEFALQEALNGKAAQKELTLEAVKMIMAMSRLPSETLPFSNPKCYDNDKNFGKKVNAIRSELAGIAKKAGLGGGVEDIDKRIDQIEEKINGWGRQEQRMLDEVESTLNNLEPIIEQFDQVVEGANKLHRTGHWFLESRMHKDMTEVRAAMHRTQALQEKIDQLHKDLDKSRAQVDKLTDAMFSTSAAARTGKAAIARVEEEMERMRSKQRGELLLLRTQNKVQVASSKVLQESAEKARAAAVETLQAVTRERDHFREQSENTTKHDEKLQRKIQKVKDEMESLKLQHAEELEKLTESHKAEVDRINALHEASFNEFRVVYDEDKQQLEAQLRSTLKSYGTLKEDMDEEHLKSLKKEREALSPALQYANAMRDELLQEKTVLEQQLEQEANMRASMRQELLQTQAQLALSHKTIDSLKEDLGAMRVRLTPSLQDQWIRSVGDSVDSIQGRLCLNGVKVLISNIYVQKIAADIADDDLGDKRQTLREFVYDFFLFKFGLQTFAEMHLYMLIKAIEAYHQEDPTVALFGALCGAPNMEAMPEYAIHFHTFFLSKVYEYCRGPSKEECTTGQAHYNMATLCSVVKACLREVLQPQELSALLDHLEMLPAIPGGEEDDDNTLHLPLGEVSLEVLRAWRDEDSHRGDKFRKAFEECDDNGDGVLSYEEFHNVLGQIAPGSDERTMQKLWRGALEETGSVDNTIEPSALEIVAHQLGIGVLKSQLPQARVSSVNSHNDLNFLQDSWSQIRPLVQTACEKLPQLEVIEEENESYVQLQTLQQQTIELDAILSQEESNNTADSTDSAWKLYRRTILGLHMWNQKGELQQREEIHDTLGASAFDTVFN